MEIEENKYIKTVAGHIGKIINYDDGMYTAKMKDVIIDLYIDDIVKHSKNIIDLIEAGDYVNGVEVVGIVNECRNNETEKSLYMASDVGTGYANQMFSEHIKSIVTKEQFKSVEYRLED